MAEIVNPLNYEEKAELESLVVEIRQWIKTGFKVGRALEKIRDK